MLTPADFPTESSSAGSSAGVTSIPWIRWAPLAAVDVGQVQRIGADTDVTPDAGKTSASRQTFVSGNAARLSGAALRAAILERMNVAEDAQLEIGGGTIRAKDAAGEHVLELNALDADAEGYV